VPRLIGVFMGANLDRCVAAPDPSDSLPFFLAQRREKNYTSEQTGYFFREDLMANKVHDNLSAPDADAAAPRLGSVLITRGQIADRIDQLAGEILRCYESERQNGHEPEFELVIVAIMTGSLIFLADLVRAIPLPIRIAVMMVSNYPGRATQAQGVCIHYDLQENIAGKNILIVDDILDTGQTLAAVVETIRGRNPKSIRTCVLLDKILPKPKQLRPDFVGFTIPNRFVVGYGLDYGNLYRNYPEIAILENV